MTEPENKDIKRDGNTENTPTSKVGGEYDWTDWLGTGAGIASKFVPNPVAQAALLSLGPALKAGKWMFNKKEQPQPIIPVKTEAPPPPQPQPITIYNHPLNNYQPQVSNDRTWSSQDSYVYHSRYVPRRRVYKRKPKSKRRTTRRKNKR